MKALAIIQPSQDFHKQHHEVIQVPVVQNVIPSSDLIQRKSACPCDGGCPRCDGDMFIQPKLKISEPGDRYEREADRVAEQIIRMPEPHMQRQVGEGEKEEEILHTKEYPDQTPEVTTYHESPINAFKDGGQPLPGSVRTFFEPLFGHDFNGVRLHRDKRAIDMAHAVNARAFTFGKNIVFGSGEYSPETDSGKRLLAHELTHFIQNTRNRADNIIRCSSYVSGGFSYNSPIEELNAYNSSNWNPSTVDFMHTARSYIAADSIQAFLSDITAQPDQSINSISLIGHGTTSGFKFSGTRNAGNTDFDLNLSNDLSWHNLRQSSYLVNLALGRSSLRTKFAPNATITFYACDCGNDDYLQVIADFFNVTAYGFSGRVWWCPNYDRATGQWSNRGFTSYPNNCGSGAAQLGTGHLTPDNNRSPRP